MDYAVIRVGGKQHLVRDGETLVVDRVRTDEGGTFEPDVLLGEDGVKVTLTVLAHERGPKLRIGKYRRRTGYKRHNGFRAATSRIEVTIGDGKKRAAKKKAAPKAEPEPVEAKPAPEVEAVAVATPETEPAPEPGLPGLPEGYGEMTVAEIGKTAKSWDREQLEAAQAYEEAHAARKGAFAAIESALAALDEEED
jgi:large subunit ribosomal protein L21